MKPITTASSHSSNLAYADKDDGGFSLAGTGDSCYQVRNGEVPLAGIGDMPFDARVHDLGHAC